MDDYYQDLQICSDADRSKHFAGFLEEFEREVIDFSNHCGIFIISSEHFHSRLRNMEEINNLRSLLLKIFDDVKVLCYFREQSELVRSVYSTAIKKGSTESPELFFSKISVKNHYYNYHIFFQKWANIFGKSCVSAIVFDKKHWFEQDIRKDFIKRVLNGINLNDLNFNIPSSNVSLSYWQSVLIRAINVSMPRYDRDGKLNQLRRELVRFIANSDVLDCSKILNMNAPAIYAAFNESNCLFASEFLGNAQNPFEPPRPIAENLSASLSLQNEIGSRLFEFFSQFTVRYLGARLLSDTDAEKLKNMVLSIERNENLGVEDISYLIEKANSVRPHNPIIKKMYEEYKILTKNNLKNGQLNFSESSNKSIAGSKNNT